MSHVNGVFSFVSAWDQQMQSGKKKREEIQQKYMEKFKTSGVRTKKTVM